jgi:hypothetical protein
MSQASQVDRIAEEISPAISRLPGPPDVRVEQGAEQT